MENQYENLVFFIKCKEAINSSFIMFESKLEDMMYSLAETPIVYSIVEKCLKDYDYFTLKQKHLILPTANNNGGFFPPSDRRDFIALCFNVLYEVYEKKMPFIDLIDLYFYGNGYKEKFDDFKEILLTFE